MLPTAEPGGAWAGGAEADHKVQNTVLGELASQLAETGRQVKAVVQTQAEQVSGGRETLGNVVNGIDLAIPVSHALYFSGPAGPAISLQFQLAVAGSATGTCADTINEMHEDAQGNAERLNALTRKYDEMFKRLPAAADVS